jgi:hypothetical protein
MDLTPKLSAANGTTWIRFSMKVQYLWDSYNLLLWVTFNFAWWAMTTLAPLNQNDWDLEC